MIFNQNIRIIIDFIYSVKKKFLSLSKLFILYYIKEHIIYTTYESSLLFDWNVLKKIIDFNEMYIKIINRSSLFHFMIKTLTVMRQTNHKF